MLLCGLYVCNDYRWLRLQSKTMNCKLLSKKNLLKKNTVVSVIDLPELILLPFFEMLYFELLLDHYFFWLISSILRKKITLVFWFFTLEFLFCNALKSWPIGIEKVFMYVIKCIIYLYSKIQWDHIDHYVQTILLKITRFQSSFTTWITVSDV